MRTKMVSNIRLYFGGA